MLNFILKNFNYLYLNNLKVGNEKQGVLLKIIL